MGCTPLGANSYLYEMTPIQKEGKNENDRVASPESVPITLNPKVHLNHLGEQF